MKARILIIEDVSEMADLMSMYLAKDGISSRVCETAEQGLAALREETFDLILLDLNLPGMDGFEFLQTIRKDTSVPVIIVSARDADEDLVMGLGIGADEFVTKPFSPKVLVARVRAHLRRAHNSLSGTQNIARFGPYAIDLDAYTLKKDNKRVQLSAKEFEVLAFLVRNRGKALTPESIYNAVWENPYGDISAIAVYIQRLRKKLEDDPSRPVYIETVHGMGYRFLSE